MNKLIDFPNSDLFLRVFSKSYLYIILFAGISALAFSQEKPADVKRTRIQALDTIKRTVSQPVQKPDAGTPTGRGSQILDDSTKNVYGPKTTLWTTEQSFFFNKPLYQPLDTTLSNYHRWTHVQLLNNTSQDLGNVGTALNPIFPSVPTTIGADPGYHSYVHYYETEEPRYYDTKSPFTRIFIVWGGDGRATTKVEFSRNIKPNWNFGFNYRPILVDKQIQRARKGDRQTISHYYDFHTSYRSLDDRYVLLASFRRMRHRVNESGGVLLTRDTTINGYFEDNPQPYLLAAQSDELRNVLHVYQSYKISTPLQVYQKLDIGRQRNRFTDTKSSETNYSDYFLFTNTDPDIDTVNVRDGIEFKSLTNELGVKGNAFRLFYSLYYKLRLYSAVNRYVAESEIYDPTGVENYLGGQVAWQFDSLNQVGGKAEYLLDGNYRLQANLNTRWVDASATTALVKPSILSTVYRGSHHSWVNTFNDRFHYQLTGFLKGNWDWLFISPGITYNYLTNYIYYKSNPVSKEPQVLPVQSTGIQQIMTPELRMSVRFLRHVYFRPQLMYNEFLRNDAEAVRMPTWFLNAQLAYENMLFKRAIQVQIGVDAHWKSDYTALNYDPAIQQFYVQDGFINPAYPLVDVFFNGKFSRGRFFVKYHNLVQAITKSGYLPTPGYPAKANVLDFGFDLLLFD